MMEPSLPMDFVKGGGMKDKRISLRGAINRKCRECIYDQHAGAGTWRQQVEACTATKCPLYEVRPVSATESDETQEVQV